MKPTFQSASLFERIGGLTTVLVGASFIAIFVLSIAAFEMTGSDRTLYIVHAPSPNQFDALRDPGKHLSLDILAIDHTRRLMTIEVNTTAPAGSTQIVTYLSFIADYLQREKVLLNEQARHTLRSGETPGPGWTVYKGTTVISFDANVARFPFDRIDLLVATDEDERFSPGTKVDRAPVKFLWIKSRDVNFVLKARHPATELRGGNRYFAFQLQRATFSIFLTVFLIAVAFLSSLFIIQQVKTGKASVPLLAYFVALWGIRDISLSGIQGPRLFPTYVDLAIVVLFCVTLSAAFLARGAARESHDSSDTPRG